MIAGEQKYHFFHYNMVKVFMYLQFLIRVALKKGIVC